MDARAGHRCRIAAPEAREVRLGGVRIDPIPPRDLPDLVRRMLECGAGHVVHFVPADPVTRAARDPAYRAVLNRGALNLPDGMGVVWALRTRGVRTERVAGPDALGLLTGPGVLPGARHYLYGGSPRVVGELAARLRRTSPGIRIAGEESPPFEEPSEREIASVAGRIRSASADLVWIGLGTPKQDLVADRLAALDAAPVLLCVGAAFDFASGAKRRAPVWMQRAGLEWAHRLATEPRRLWRRYLFGNVRFVAGVLREGLAAGASRDRP
ncbi:MAG: WecB/TagA/CpsF family glycosyltransferase [Actinobacteria bacterium]|nr:WecB/TagA/CpsF family glycosyltransferase [Actinomycetota bacterium]